MYIALLFFVYLNAVTLIMSIEDIVPSTVRMLKCMNIILMGDYLIRKHGYEYSIKLFLVVAEILNYINAFFMLIYPNGLYRTIVMNGIDTVVKNPAGFVRTTERVHWLLGHQSTLIRILLPSICLALIYNVLQRRGGKKLSKRSVLLILVCCFEAIRANSAGNLVVLALFIGLIIFQYKKAYIKVWQVLTGVFIFYTSAAMVIATSKVMDFLGSILGRQVDLLARVQIWAATIVAFLKSPIIGWGYIDELGKIRNILPGVGNPHSDYFWVLYEGGIIGIVLFVLLIRAVGKQSEGKCGKIEIIAYSAFICFLIMILADDHIFRTQFALLLLPLCYHASD